MVLNTFASFAGIFKPGLSREERARFRGAIERNRGFEMDSAAVFEGRSSLVFCFPLPKAAEAHNPTETGGACILSFRAGVISREGCSQTSGDPAYDFSSPGSAMKEFSGSWALADIEEERITLARDSAGAYTVYHGVKDGVFHFTTSLTWFNGIDFSIDPEGVVDFLHFLYIPSPRTIFKGVESVLPGQTVSYDGRALRKEAFSRNSFEEDDFAAEHKVPEAEYLKAYEELLKKSVQRACPKNGKAALFLSGGKDSSTLAIAVKLAGLENIEAVTLGFDEKNIDETEDARVVAKHLGIPFVPLRFSPLTYLEGLRGFAGSMGQPFGDPAAIPLYAALKQNKDRFDVYIDGTGNDRYLGIPVTWQEDLAWKINQKIPGLNHLPWWRLGEGFSYSADVLRRTLSRPREEQFVSWKGWTDKEIFRLTGRRPDWSGHLLYRLYSDTRTPMEHKTRTLCEIWEPEAAFRKTVQIANALGKTVRFPFLDRDLVRYSERLPSALKYRGSVNKVIIRMLLEKYLPREIVTKKKGTFNFPKDYILATNNYECLRLFLSEEAVRKHNLVDHSMVSGYVERYIKGETVYQDRLWALVLLHSWLEFGRH
ncbi:MAG: asparagine synthase [Deltaproteobacteria bacterium]|nr:asparagine synthase [Deltaproteobacteria bacterium]